MSNDTALVCPDCCEDVTELHEGYCPDCLAERQWQLDEHNARCDWWDGLTDAEKDGQIRRAARGF